MSDAELVQRSDDWYAARCGSLGASCLHEAIARTRTGWGASRANRMATMVLELFTGVPQDRYQNAAMRNGIELEPEARVAYEYHHNVEIKEVGLVRHPEIAGTHASPDGLIGDDGVLEIKCPQPAQHIATLLGEPIADKYYVQMQWQMRCCHRDWCHFVSYNPVFGDAPDRETGLPAKLFIKRVERDDKRIAELEKDVLEFLAEMRAKVAKLRRRYEAEPYIVMKHTNIQVEG